VFAALFLQACDGAMSVYSGLCWLLSCTAIRHRLSLLILIQVFFSSSLWPFAYRARFDFHGEPRAQGWELRAALCHGARRTSNRRGAELCSNISGCRRITFLNARIILPSVAAW